MRLVVVVLPRCHDLRVVGRDRGRYDDDVRARDVGRSVAGRNARAQRSQTARHGGRGKV